MDSLDCVSDPRKLAEVLHDYIKSLPGYFVGYIQCTPSSKIVTFGVYAGEWDYSKGDLIASETEDFLGHFCITSNQIWFDFEKRFRLELADPTVFESINKLFARLSAISAGTN